MSSYSNPQQSNVPPGPGGPQFGPPPGEVQPYVEQGAPYPGAQQPPYAAPGGGQPPYLPPGAYAPAGPPMQPRRGRGAKIAIASILSVALLLGVGAVVLFKFVLNPGPDPAESFPGTASMYVEVNLDPDFDQTPKLLEHLNKFDDLDYADTDDMVSDLMEEAEMEGVEGGDVTSWLGRRHGVAMWTYEDKPYAVISLASTDADAAEDGMAKLRDSAEATEDEFAYKVNDDSVLIVAGEGGAADALAAAEGEASSEPLSASADYEEARSWLGDDQLLVYWADNEAMADQAGIAEMMGPMMGTGALDSLYKGQIIAGVAAFDEGFEMSYRMFGEEDDPFTGSGDLLTGMGELPASDIALSADVPDDIAAHAEKWVEDFEELSTGATGSAEAEAVEPMDGEPLTDAEYEEYLELEEQYINDYGNMSVEDEERYWELADRFYMYGTEDEPYVYEEEEYDYGPDWDQVSETVGEFADLLAGSQLSLAADFLPDDDVDTESVFFEAVLADERAQELNDMVSELAEGEGEELPEGVEIDGSSLTLSGDNVADGKLADDDRFTDFAGSAPSESAVAVWVDLKAAAESNPDDFEGMNAMSAFAWSHGSVDGDGTGLARLYLE